jgi:hypothetical protein
VDDITKPPSPQKVKPARLSFANCISLVMAAPQRSPNVRAVTLPASDFTVHILRGNVWRPRGRPDEEISARISRSIGDIQLRSIVAITSALQAVDAESQRFDNALCVE